MATMIDEKAGARSSGARPEGSLRLAVAPVRDVRVSDPTASGDGSYVVSGYAAVFDSDTVLYDGRWFRIREEIAAGAFSNVLSRLAAGEGLVHLNHGHDQTSVLAATNVTGIGGLHLREDTNGLYFEARVDAEDPDAVRLAHKMRRGIVAQASFAFTIAEETLTVSTLPDGREDEFYRVLEVGDLYDVCACAQGAYPQTSASIRALTLRSMAGKALDLAERGDGKHARRNRRQAVERMVADELAGALTPAGLSGAAELVELARRCVDELLELEPRFRVALGWTLERLALLDDAHQAGTDAVTEFLQKLEPPAATSDGAGYSVGVTGSAAGSPDGAHAVTVERGGAGVTSGGARRRKLALAAARARAVELTNEHSRRGTQ